MLIVPSRRLYKLIPSCGVQVGKISKGALRIRLVPMACSLRNGNRRRLAYCDNVRGTGLSGQIKGFTSGFLVQKNVFNKVYPRGNDTSGETPQFA